MRILYPKSSRFVNHLSIETHLDLATSLFTTPYGHIFEYFSHTRVGQLLDAVPLDSGTFTRCYSLSVFSSCEE